MLVCCLCCLKHIAIAVQRGNADIMIQDSVRKRGTTWPRRRKVARRGRTPAQCHARRRVRHRQGDKTEGGHQETPDAHEMTRVARLIGLLDLSSAGFHSRLNEVDSEAETEPTGQCEDMQPTQLSFIPETPLSVRTEVSSDASTLVLSGHSEAECVDEG